MRFSLKRLFRNAGKAISVALVLAVLMGIAMPAGAGAEEAPATDSQIYGMLYYYDKSKQNADGSYIASKNIELVLQKGSQPDPSKELVVDSEGKKGIVKFSKADAYPSWYNFAPTSNNYNIIKVDFKDKLQPSSIAGWFRNCKLLTGESFTNKQNLDTSECTDMQYTFYLCSGLKSIDFTEWTNFKAEKVRKLNYFLSDCTSIVTADLTTLHPGACTEAQYVFKNCYALEKVKLKNFNITANNGKKLTYMNNFFMGCRKLVTVGNSDNDSVNLSEFKAPYPKSYDSMFRGCTSLRKADLSSLGAYNTNELLYISHMFYDCTSIEEIDMSNFKIEFSPRNFLVNATSLRELKVPDATKTANLGKNESRAIFQYVDKLAYVELSSAWAKNAALTYLPANETWTKTKLSNNTGEEPLERTKTAAELFKNFQTGYAGGWSAQATFEFKGNGGTPESQSFEGEKNQTLVTTGIQTPTREGYTFDGWYSEPEGGEEFNGTANHWTYYAHWEDIEYNLILDGNGGVTSDSASQITINKVKYSDWVELVKYSFANSGKVLVGWNTNQNGSGTSYSATDSIGMLTPTSGSYTLYAMWSDDPHATVSFDPNGGSDVSPKTYTLPANYGVLSESEKTDYTFMGWFTEESGGVKIKENDPVTGNIELHAHWEKNPTVTLNPNGGYFVNGTGEKITTPETKECSYNGTVGYLTVPSHATASFLGWFTENGTEINSETVVTSDVTYYAHWGYRPVLDTDGGIIEDSFEGFDAADSPANYELPELPTVYRDNYTFGGWFHDETLVTAGTKIDLSANKVIKAKWTQNEIVTITLDVNGGQLPDGAADTIEIYKGNTIEGNPIAELPTPTREDYDFDGWFIQNTDTSVTAETKLNADTTLTAKWTERTCKVTFHAGKGTLLGDEVVYVPEGRVLTYIPGIYNPAVGEVFLGWYPNADGTGGKLRPSTVINGNTDYYPKWGSKIIPDSDTGINFMAQWDTPNDSGVTDTGDYLVFFPRNNNQVTATLKVVLMMDGVQQTAVPAYALKLKIPKYVFEDYNGKGVGTNNIDTMASQKYERVTAEEDENYYVITNKVPILSDFDTFTIDYTVTPRQVPGGHEDDNRRFAGDFYQNDEIDVILEINKSSYGLENKTYTQTLGLEFHTMVYTTASKSRSNVTLEWNESWGERPADADEYFYVTWSLISDQSNTSSQRYKLMWDEDTVGRDGSIVYTSGAVGYQTGWRTNGRSTAYVVTKHRRDTATTQTIEGDKWVPVNNEAVLNVEWESGHKEQYRVTATATAYIPTSGSGAYSLTKTIPNQNNNSAHYIHGGQELILNGESDNMPKLPYEIKYTENYNVDNPTWNEDNRYSAPKRTMTITDCADPKSNDVLISNNNGDFSTDTWSNSYGLVDGDYYFDKLTINVTEYNAAKLGDHWSNPTEHPIRDDYDVTHVYIRRQNTNVFEPWSSQRVPKEGWVVTLPADTAGFKIVHTSSSYATTISVKTNVCLKPTSRLTQYVNAAVKAGDYTIIKNKAHITVATENNTRTLDTSDNGSWAASYVLDMSDIHLYARKDCADNDSDVTYHPDTLTESFPAVISGWNYNNSGNKTPFRTGEFYDLLPKDYSVDKDSIFVKPITENLSENYYSGSPRIKANKYDSEKAAGGELPKGSYSVRFVDNWKNTGRTMMIVQVSIPDSILATGVNVFYQMRIRYASIYENGVTQNNIMVFRDTTEGQIAPESKSTGINEGDVPADMISLFAEFDGDNTAFASDSTHTIQPLVREAGLSTAVYTEESGMSEHEIVGLNSNYSYHVAYSSGSGARCSDMVIYNVLEHRVEGAQSEWSGEFLGVDVSAIEAVSNEENSNAKCAPVVYYSTYPKDEFFRLVYPDENDTFNLGYKDKDGNSIWTTEKPADLSTVTAVAVDCRKDNKGNAFYLAPEQMLDFNINMKSISDKSRNDIYAYNEAVIRFNINKTDRTHLLSKTDVLLHFNTPQLDKTSFPSSGEQNAPASVVKKSTINYTLKVTNPDSTVTMNDIVVTDSFDKTLVSVSPENITARLGDEADALISKHARINSASFDPETGKFTATIGTLEPGETLYITIPVTVRETAADQSVIANTAQITSVNGVEFNVQSPTTYHVIDALKLKVMKVNSKGEPLAGAKLKIFGSNGTTVVKDEFTTTLEPMIFEINAGSYILRETSTPSGYKTAQDISFRVTGDGRVYINDTVYDSVTMVDEPDFKVIFHENHQEQSDKNVVFRIYEQKDLKNDLVEHFYDIPGFAADEYVFAGWYHNSGYTLTENPDSGDLIPADFEHDAFTGANTGEDSDYHLYAKWIKVGTVETDSQDTNVFSGGYRGFGLAGVQIRHEKGPDDETMYDPNERDEGVSGEEYNNSGKKTPAGLRFVTSLSESLLAGINNIGKIDTAADEAKNFGVEYGYVVGLSDDINEFLGHYKPADSSAYRLQYKGENVNGVNTTVTGSIDTDYRYITNVDCTSKQGTTANRGLVLWDHRNFTGYRLYTLVITYEDAESKKEKMINARAYIRYYDANGKLRVFYNSYRNNRYYGGCMCSYSQVAG